MKTRTILKHSNLVFALLATFCLLLGNAITVSAAESPKTVTEIGIGIDDSKIQPRYIVSCSHASGKHLMDGRGTGHAYKGSKQNSTFQFAGQASQCRYCHLVLITQNNPFFGQPWGRYAYWNPAYEVGGIIYMYTNSFGTSNTHNDPFVLGFRFA